MPAFQFSRRHFLALAGSVLAACGGGSSETGAKPTAKAAVDPHEALARPFWNQGGGDDLLHGKTFQALFNSLPDRAKAFELKDTYLRCIDEGCPGGLHLAGSGCLYERAATDFKGKITGIYTHEGCGAARLYVESKKIKTDNPDSVADEEAKKLADKLGVPYLGRIPAADMKRPPDLHDARVIYYDGTGKFDPSLLPGMPKGFMVSRRFITDPSYAKTEVEVAIGIALGSHGFGHFFTGKSPLYVVAVSGLASDSLPLKLLGDELKAVTQAYPNVEVHTLDAGPGGAQNVDRAKSVVKAAEAAGGDAHGKGATAGGAADGGHGAAAVPGVARKFGNTLHIKDKLVNLADPGGRRFLKFSAAVEFEPHEDPTKKAGGEPSYRPVVYVPGDQVDQPVTGGAGTGSQKEFEAGVRKYVPAIEDAFLAVLSRRTSAEILPPAGKEAAKKEIIQRIQRIVGDAEHVTDIFFTEFVVQ